MYKINVDVKRIFPERDLVISILQKLGGRASIDEIYDFLDESLSKDVIVAVLSSQSQFTVKQEKWSPEHLISPIWVYIGPKPELADLFCI